jgi:hypothetical protein
MKFSRYLIIVSFFMIAGCSDDKSSAAKTQPASQENSGTKAKESKGALGHYVGQVESAKEAKRMQEEADKKRREAVQGI